MKKLLFVLPIVALLAAGCASNKQSSNQTTAPQNSSSPLPGAVLVSWRQPQACPQYGGTKQCYVPEGANGGYANWAATRATFIWRVNPCTSGKTVARIDQASCVYETNGAQGQASTTLDHDSAIIDCRSFAAQFQNDDCNCNNGITLSARVECK